MARHIHFEVQVQQGGRWSIHAQFGAAQREKAIEEAKKIEKTPGFDSVKVVKETYDSDMGNHQDTTIYRGPKGAEEHKGFRDIGAGRGGNGDAAGGGGDWSMSRSGDDDGDYDDDDDAPRKRRSSGANSITATATGVVVKMLMLALVSLLVSGGFAVAFSWYFSGKMLFGYKIVGTVEANAIFLVFVASFLLTASTLAITYLRNIRLKGRQPQAGAMAARPMARAGGSSSLLDKAAAALSASPADRMEVETEKPEGSVGDWREQAKAEEATQMETSDAANERLRDALDKDDDGKRGVTLEADKYGQQDQSPQLDAAGEKQKAYMMKFLGQLLDVTGQDKKKLDNFTKFGINLFLAGACESLSSKRDLDASTRARILADSVQVMGFKKSHASSFADRYEEYLLQDARYMSMFQAGRNAMATHLSDNTSGPSHLKTALEDWNKPKPKEAQARVVAVLFTDIAGSTALTQELGDAGAQEVVRAHNKIVRENLTRFQGREVKHTGDGMMCSFDQPTNAVEAAIEIQKETIQLRSANSNLPLKLKIGINAGEPIAEDNDLFGTTVQLAARIVDKAQADQVFVSETVKGICTGKGVSFKSAGGYAMKGFDGDVQLYEVMWQSGNAAKAS
ncbi:MAG: adenylate/guanylate cyclase domain-containing protein [Rhodospirillales bacterium]